MDKAVENMGKVKQCEHFLDALYVFEFESIFDFCTQIRFLSWKVPRHRYICINCIEMNHNQPDWKSFN